MNITTVISVPEWLFSLLVRRSPDGRYYVQLAGADNTPVKHSTIIGGFESIDWIVMNAPQLYADLLERLNADMTPPAKVFEDQGEPGPSA